MWDGTTWIIYSAGTTNAHAATHSFGNSDPILITANQISDFNTSAVTANSSHINATTSVHGISNTANLVYTSDSRLTDSRTPNTHAASHGSGGSDAITIAESQVTNLVTDLGLKAPLASPTFTGIPSAPTAAVDTNTTQIATTQYVNSQGYLKTSAATSIYLTISSAVSTYATLDSPYFFGTPFAPTASSGTNNTQLATTAFVNNAIAIVSPTQIGNAGKFLYTNGSITSWETLSALPSQTGNAGKTLVTDGTIASWSGLATGPDYTNLFLLMGA